MLIFTSNFEHQSFSRNITLYLSYLQFMVRIQELNSIAGRVGLEELEAEGTKSPGEGGWTEGVLEGCVCVCVCVCGGGGGGGGGGGLRRRSKLRTTLHTTELSPQNSFGESHTWRLKRRWALRRPLSHTELYVFISRTCFLRKKIY